MQGWLIAHVVWLRVALGLTFALAGISKMRNPESFAAVIEALGIRPPALRDRLKILIPGLETALGLWLLTGYYSLLSIPTAFVVLAVLTAVLVDLRGLGYTGSCSCFIGDHRPVGRRHLIRNGLLLGLTGLTGTGSYLVRSAEGALTVPFLSFGLWTLAAAGLGVGLYLSAVRKIRTANAQQNDENHGLNGSSAQDDRTTLESAPELRLEDLKGRPVALGQASDRVRLVVFARGKCPGCLEDRRALNELFATPQPFRAVFICGGDPDLAREFGAEVRPEIPVVSDPRWRAAVAFGVTTTPFCVLVDEKGRIRGRGELAEMPALIPRHSIPEHLIPEHSAEDPSEALPS